MEIQIGKYNNPLYPQIHNKVAVGLYDFSRSLAVLAPKDKEIEASKFLESIIVKILNKYPIGDIEIYLYQMRASEKYKQIKRLYAATIQSIGVQFFDEQSALRHIEKLNEQVNRRHAEISAAEVSSIFDYNRKYRTKKSLIFYIIDDIDAIFKNANTFAFISNIIENGATVGVYLAIQYNNEYYQESNIYKNQDEVFYNFLSKLLSNMLGLNLYKNKPNIFNMDYHYTQFINDFGYKLEFPDNYIKNMADQYLQNIKEHSDYDSKQDYVKIKIGEYQNNDVFFSLGPVSMSYYALISGGSGSGKSILLQDIVLGICENYQPYEVQLILVDFGRTTFGLLDNRIAHIPTTFLGLEDINKLRAIFLYIKQEKERRAKLFDELSKQTNKIIDELTPYRQTSGKKMPVIVVFFDELAAIFDDLSITYERKQEVATFINTTANQLRKYGVFIILSTQSYAAGSGLSSKLDSYFANCQVRIGLKPNTSLDFTALMGQGNDGYQDIRNTTDRRQLIFNNDAGNPKANILVDINQNSPDTISTRLQKIINKHPKTKQNPIEKGVKDAYRTVLDNEKKSEEISQEHDWLL